MIINYSIIHEKGMFSNKSVLKVYYLLVKGTVEVFLESNSDCDPLLLHNVIKASRSLKVTVGLMYPF